MTKDTEHELDRIADKLYRGYCECEKFEDGLYYTTVQLDKTETPLLYGSDVKAASTPEQSKQNYLAKLREIVGPDPALTQRIVELEAKNKQLWEYVNGARPTLIINDEIRADRAEQRIAELEKELAAIHERDRTMYDFKAHKEYIEKEVEQAELRGEKRGFEAAREQEMYNGNDPDGQRAALYADMPAALKPVGFSCAWRNRYKDFDDYKQQKG